MRFNAFIWASLATAVWAKNATVLDTDDPNLVAASERSLACEDGPVAVCRDITTWARPENDCQSGGSIDGGSTIARCGNGYIRFSRRHFYFYLRRSISITQLPKPPYGIGTTTVTLTVTDSKGASDTCTGKVKVEGQGTCGGNTDPPKIFCKKRKERGEREEKGQEPPKDAPIDNGSTAANGGPLKSITQEAKRPYKIGTTQVTLKALDSNNNTNTRTRDAAIRPLIWQDRSILGQTARDIGCGNSINWIIGEEQLEYGSYIYWNYLHQADGKWTKFFGQGDRIDVDQHDDPWVVNNLGDVWQRKRRVGWVKRAEALASDIGVSKNDGSVFIIGRESKGYGSYIYKWTGGTDWVKQPGQATAISVDPRGNPWVINKLGMIWRWVNDGWERSYGPNAKDIAVGIDGTVMIAGGDMIQGKGYRVFVLEGGEWHLIEHYGYATAICVFHRFQVSTVRSDGRIFRVWH